MGPIGLSFGHRVRNAVQRHDLVSAGRSVVQPYRLARLQCLRQPDHARV